MEDLFGHVDDSLPELQIFERVNNPAEVEEAIEMYRILRNKGISEDEAVRLAVEELVPLRFSSLRDQ